ncbi:MAG TPA: wax ester/triacylglycerol synthase family O-acyltransferase [Frankiaceae bacterium]|nr:wax ester/triacylglycerol synthase family O-acyltransferase [Frankiaceae bacterium]
MDHLSPLDAAFLEAEDSDTHTSMGIASLGIFEGPAPSHAEMLALIERALPKIPRYRQRVRSVPLDLGPPVWVDDPAFDLRFHVRRTALPKPGGDVELRHLMARVMAQRIDRERPLWETWIVEGLEGDRWALLSKLHHSMADGVSGTDLLRVVLDTSPDAPPPDHATALPPWTPEPEPSTLRLTVAAVRDLALNPVGQLRSLERLVRAYGDFGRRALDTGRGLLALSGAIRPATGSSLNGPIGRQRRYRWARADQADIKAVRSAFGGTMNDVVLSAISGGFRALMIGRGEAPEAHSVRSLVPVSVRAPGEEGIYENRVSMLLPFLPVDIADPVARLEAVKARLLELKSSREAVAGQSITALAGQEPFPLVSPLVRLGFRLPQRTIVTVTTNVPGPRAPLYALGRRLLEIFPYVPISTTVRIGVAIFTYCDQVTFGITGDYDSSGDIDVLVRGLEESFAELVKAATPASSAAKV